MRCLGYKPCSLRERVVVQLLSIGMGGEQTHSHWKSNRATLKENGCDDPICTVPHRCSIEPISSRTPFRHTSSMESSQSLELQRHIRVAVVPLGNTSEYAVAAVQHHLSLVGFPLAYSVRRRPVMLQDIPDFEIYTTRFKSRENESNTVNILYTCNQTHFGEGVISPFESFFVVAAPWCDL